MLNPVGVWGSPAGLEATWPIYVTGADSNIPWDCLKVSDACTLTDFRLIWTHTRHGHLVLLPAGIVWGIYRILIFSLGFGEEFKINRCIILKAELYRPEVIFTFCSFH